MQLLSRLIFVFLCSVVVSSGWKKEMKAKVQKRCDSADHDYYTCEAEISCNFRAKQQGWSKKVIKDCVSCFDDCENCTFKKACKFLECEFTKDNDGGLNQIGGNGDVKGTCELADNILAHISI